MTGRELLLDAFGRIPEMVHGVVEGLTPDQLTARLDPGANSIAWLIWHLSRIEDDHIAELAGGPQVWAAGGWAKRWRLPFAAADTGYGHTAKEVAAVTGDPKLLLGYFDAVHEMTVKFLGTATAADLDRIVDEDWDPPVTMGVRLISVAGHNFEQAAQADFIRGVLERRERGSAR
jgi:hypothetical protein